MNIKALKKFRKRYAYYFGERKYNGKKYIATIIVDKKTKVVYIFDLDDDNAKNVKKSMYQKFINRNVSTFIYNFFGKKSLSIFKESKQYWLHK